MARNSVIQCGLAMVASALCACSGHGADAGQTVEAEDGGVVASATFVPVVGGVPDAAPPFGPLDPVPCGSLGLDPIAATAFSPGGDLLAVAGSRIRLLNTSDWREIRQFADSPALVGYQWERLAFVSGGTLLVSVGYYSGLVAVWNVQDGTLVYSLTSPVNPNLWDGAQSVATSAAGLLALTDGDSVVLWDVARQRALRAIAPTEGKVGRLALSEAGDRLAVEELQPRVADGGTQPATARVSLWDADTGRLLKTLATDGAQAGALAFSPEADVLAMAVAEYPHSYIRQGHVNFYRVSDGTLLRFSVGFDVSITPNWRAALTYAPAGDLVALASDDSYLGARTLTIIRASDAAELNQLGFYGGAISLSPGGRLAIPHDATVEIRNPLDGTITNVISQGERSQSNALALSPSGAFLATAGGAPAHSSYNGVFDYDVYLWRLADRALVAQLAGHVGRVESLAFSPDGLTIASGSDDATVRLWSTTGTSAPVVLGQDLPVSEVGFSPDGRWLASADAQGAVLLRNAQDGSVLRSLKAQDTVRTLAFSNDGTLLATGGSNPTIVLWEVETGQLIASASHGDEVEALAFSPDGSWLVSAASTNVCPPCIQPDIQVWQVSGGSLVARTTIATEGTSVWGLAISPDGTTLLSAGPQNRGQLYRLPEGDHIGEFGTRSFGGAFAASRDTSRIAVGYGAIDLWCRTP